MRVYYGWVIIFVTATLQFAGGTPTFPVLGLFLKPETQELGWSSASFALPLTIGTILGGFAGALTGPAMDKYGPRWIMTFAAIIVGTLFFLMGFVQELWQHFVVAMALRVVTVSAFFMVVGIVIPRWFVIKRGRAVALSALGGSLGQFLNPIIVSMMIQEFGWRAAWGTLGAMVWLIALPPVFFLLRNRPEDMGLLPDGLAPGEAQRLIDESNAKEGRRKKSLDEVSFTPREALATRSFYLMLASQSALSLVISGLHFHWFSYMTSKGLADSVAAASISISSIASIPASLAGGFLAERFHLRYILLAANTGFAVSVMLLLLTDTPIMAYTYGIFMGVFSGITFTLAVVAWADYYGRRHLGSIRGLVSPVASITNACGPLVASLAYDASGSYTGILIVFIGSALTGSVLWFFAPPPRKKLAPMALAEAGEA